MDGEELTHSLCYLWRMDLEIKYHGKGVTQQDINFINKLISDNPADSRRALSKKLCRAWNWTQANGILRAKVKIDQTPLEVRLSKNQPLEIRQVRGTPYEKLFNGLIAQYHYLGYCHPVGERLKYIVSTGGRPIACFLWSSAPRHIGSRDKFIGWSAAIRKKNSHLIG